MPEGPAGTVECPVVNRSFRCQAPAGRFDLRLRARGFVSHFRWGVAVEAGLAHDLGTLSLVAGASLVGRLELADGKLDPLRARVRLSPMLAAPTPADQTHRHAAAGLSTQVSEQGLFHFQGLAAGSYRLEAEHPGMAPAKLEPLTIFAQAETELASPITLAPPLTALVVVTPPLDPEGKPWHFQLWLDGPVAGLSSSVAKGELGPAGSHRQQGLAPGLYRLRIADRSGSSMAFDSFRLAAEGERVEIDLPLVWLEGRLRYGDEPLAAEIWFGGRGGRESVRLLSDDEGEFFGYLPRDGRWQVEVLAEQYGVSRRLQGVEVRKRSGAGSAKVELQLPATEIGGVVVDRAGTGQARARVTLVSEEAAEFQTTTSDFEGFFTLRGVAPGTGFVVAETAGKSSPREKVAVLEDAATPSVRLVVEPLEVLSGRVFGPGGGVAAAFVEAEVFDRSGVPIPPLRSAVADVAGNFRLDLPADAVAANLTLLPPGFAIGFVRLLDLERVRTAPLEIAVSPLSGQLDLSTESGFDWEDPTGSKPALFFADGAFAPNVLYRWARLHGQEPLDPHHLSPDSGPTPRQLPGLRREPRTCNVVRRGATDRTLRGRDREPGRDGDRRASSGRSATKVMRLLPLPEEASTNCIRLWLSAEPREALANSQIVQPCGSKR